MANRRGIARKTRPGIATAVLRSMRPHQWVKNTLVLVPLALGGLLLEADAWGFALLGFAALCFASSAMYVVNDIHDAPNDRKHWSKRDRPIARGELSARAGYFLAGTLLAACVAVGSAIGPEEVLMLGLYVVIALIYTFFLKRIPIADILVIAGLFTLRVVLGILILDVRLSPWLLVFSMFVFVSLSAAKRNTELKRWDKNTGALGRGYTREDGPVVLVLGVTAMLGAVLIYIIYLLEGVFPNGVYSNTGWLWSIPPLLFLFLGRIWLLSGRGQMFDDPVSFALKDRTSLLLCGGMLLGFFAALFVS